MDNFAASALAGLGGGGFEGSYIARMGANQAGYTTDDRLTPAYWVNTAILFVQNSPDDQTFIKNVRRLKSVVRPATKIKFAELMGLEENVAKLRELKANPPLGFEDTPKAWEAYCQADFEYERLIESIYRTMPREEMARV